MCHKVPKGIMHTSYEQLESNVQTHTHSMTLIQDGMEGERKTKNYTKRNKNTFPFEWTAKRTNVYGSQTDEFFFAVQFIADEMDIFIFNTDTIVRFERMSVCVCLWLYTFHVEHVKFVCHTPRDRICPFCYIGYKVQTHSHSEPFDGPAKRSHSTLNVIMTTTDKMSLGLA